MRNFLRPTCFALGLALGPASAVTGQTNTFPGSGNVGIGTTSPQLPLEVATSSAYAVSLSGYAPSLYFGPNIGVFPNGSGDPFAAYLGLSTFTGAYGQGQGDLNIATQSRGSNNTSAINFMVPYDDNGNYMFAAKINRQGNFGIGTQSPAARVHVQTNDGSWYQGIFENVNASAGGGLQLRNNGTGSSGQGGYIIMGGTQNPYTSYQKRLSIISYANSTAGTGSSGITLSMEGTSEGPQDFRVTNNSNAQDGTLFIVTSAGNVGIGTTAPTYPLSVNGTVEAKEVVVQTGWSDYVFADGYRLTPIKEVAKAIKAEGHLPGMPSAREVAAHGISVGEMESKLLAEVEQLTLRQIEQDKRIEALEEENQRLRAKEPISALTTSVPQRDKPPVSSHL